jgi:flagellin-like protein
MNKRGVSPLIATIMLIVFSVALGAVVVSYGESFVEEQAEFVQGVPEVSAGLCDALELNFVTVGGTPRICAGDNQIQLAIDNGPEVTIDGVQARIAGTMDIQLEPNILSTPLERASSLQTTFEHMRVGQVLQVRLTPFVLEDGKQTFCTDKAIVVEDIASC